MDRIMINTMEAGKTYDTLVLVTDITQRDTKAGKPYCIFSISDGKTTVTANRFSDKTLSTLETNQTYLKKVCEISLETSLYNGGMSYIIKSVKPADEGTYNIGDFIIRAPIDAEKMYQQITGILETCNCSVKQIALNLFAQNREKLMYWSAAKAFHHNYYAGLLYHTYRMISHAVQLCKVYTKLNRDLLIIGAALHDIGKLVEFDTDQMGTASYTIDGNLFGHLLIGVEMITAEVVKNPDAYNPEEVKLLKHMIASHHGEQEMGAVRPPATMEAIALYYLDVMDARLETCDVNYANMEPGTATERNVLGLDARLYKSTLYAK